MTARLSIAAGFERVAEALADRSGRGALEEQLSDYLREQRWFGGKAREILTVRVERWFDLGADDDGCLCIVRVQDASGRKTEHQLYLGARDVSGDEREVGDALESGAVRRRLVEMLATGDAFEGEDVSLRVERSHDADCPGEGKILGADQSNTSLVFDEACLLKIYRRLERGPSPDVELSRYLSDEAGFGGVPRFLATLTADVEGATIDLMALQGWVPNDGDAWTWAQDACQRAMEGAAGGSVKRWLEEEEESVSRAAGLGRITAQLHTALAAAQGAGLAATRPDDDDRADWLGTIQEEADALLPLLMEESALRDAVEAVAEMTFELPENPGLKTRVHGDYHLGQVLITADGFVVLDFEGEPARSLRERRTLQSPLADIAGMVRSWDYAARSCCRDAPSKEAVEIATEWGRTMRARFMSAYWEEAERAEPPFLPEDIADRERLLAILELRKALYEVRYELNNRPDWVDIPGDAVIRLVEAFRDV